MYTRILVAVDGSSTSDLALDEALKLARDGQSQLLLLHVTEYPVPLSGEMDWMIERVPPQVFVDMAQRMLEKALARVRAAGMDAEIRQIDDVGRRIGNAIADEAVKWQAGLIVIGTHGRKGIDHLLLGSVAEGVVRAAPMPVLLVRGK
jgi:nucleotide-binding universal stress UspA family protein